MIRYALRRCAYSILIMFGVLVLTFLLFRVAAGDPAVEMNLQEIVGLCIMRSAKYGYAPVLIGDGSNGKSTYIGMLEALLGYSNISSLDIAEIGERLAGHVGEVVGKRFRLEKVGIAVGGGEQRFRGAKGVCRGIILFAA